MIRRTIALGLWAYFGWYLVSLVLAAMGLPAAIAPIGGIAMAAVALVDWRRLRQPTTVAGRLETTADRRV